MSTKPVMGITAPGRRRNRSWPEVLKREIVAASFAPGVIATSSYQLVINNIAVDVGDGKTPSDAPSFKNALSGVDRSTLASAFFLTHLERDKDLSRKIVVFDDPLNSQDIFRHRQTKHEILRVAGQCAQVIVLSHDTTFLQEAWEKAPAAERVSLTIADHRAQGSKLSQSTWKRRARVAADQATHFPARTRRTVGHRALARVAGAIALSRQRNSARLRSFMPPLLYW